MSACTHLIFYPRLVVFSRHDSRCAEMTFRDSLRPGTQGIGPGWTGSRNDTVQPLRASQSLSRKDWNETERTTNYDTMAAQPASPAGQTWDELRNHPESRGGGLPNQNQHI